MMKRTFEEAVSNLYMVEKDKYKIEKVYDFNHSPCNRLVLKDHLIKREALMFANGFFVPVADFKHLEAAIVMQKIPAIRAVVTEYFIYMAIPDEK